MLAKKTVKKTKNVLIISASFRPNSNSHALCQEVAKGVKAAGNKAEVIRLKDKKIGFCTGCYACQKLGKCVIKDDANAIVEKICKADAVVFGTPVYYFSIAGQLDRVGPDDPASPIRVLAELDILNAYERIRSYYLNIAETLAGGK